MVIICGGVVVFWGWILVVWIVLLCWCCFEVILCVFLCFGWYVCCWFCLVIVSVGVFYVGEMMYLWDGLCVCWRDVWMSGVVGWDCFCFVVMLSCWVGYWCKFFFFIFFFLCGDYLVCLMLLCFVYSNVEELEKNMCVMKFYCGVLWLIGMMVICWIEYWCVGWEY